MKGIEWNKFQGLDENGIKLLFSEPTSDLQSLARSYINNYLITDSYDLHDLSYDDNKVNLVEAKKIVELYGMHSWMRRFIIDFWKNCWRTEVSDTSRGVKRALEFLGL